MPINPPTSSNPPSASSPSPSPSSPASSPSSLDATAYTIALAAVTSEQATGCPAELTIAQAIIESVWLKHSPGNNCFGIKASFETPLNQRQLLHTTEYFTADEAAQFTCGFPGRTAVLSPGQRNPNAAGRNLYVVQDWFMTFPSLTECFAVHGLLFTKPPYAFALLQYKSNHDLTTFIKRISLFYATAADYSSTLLRCLNQPIVQSALTKARQDAAAGVTLMR